MSDGLATTLMLEQATFAKYEGSKALFFRDGKPLAMGDTLRNPDLAWTLEQVAKGGADGFYKGEVAKRLVQDLRGKGNAVRLTDLARYFAPERAPVEFTYRGNTVYSSAPPAGGGSILAGQLSNFERFPSPKPYPDDAATLHAMIAAWQLSPSSRNRIADPSLWPVTTEPFTNKDTAAVAGAASTRPRRSTRRYFGAIPCAAPRTRAADSAGGGAGGRNSASATVDVTAADTSRTPDESDAPHGGDTPSASGARDECAGLDHAEGAECRAQGTTAFTVGEPTEISSP